MEPDALHAGLAGFGVAAVAGFAGFLWIRRATGDGKPLDPKAFLGATAIRFVLTLVGAVALALLWRNEATAVLIGVGVGYLALLVVETRWTLARAKGGMQNTRDGGKE